MDTRDDRLFHRRLAAKSSLAVVALCTLINDGPWSTGFHSQLLGNEKMNTDPENHQSANKLVPWIVATVIAIVSILAVRQLIIAF